MNTHFKRKSQARPVKLEKSFSENAHDLANYTLAEYSSQTPPTNKKRTIIVGAPCIGGKQQTSTELN